MRVRAGAHGGVSVLLAALAAAVLASAPAAAYLKLGYEFNGDVLSLKWTSLPVAYRIYGQSAQGVAATDFQMAVARAFDSWEGVESSEISYRFEGFTLNPPGLTDGLTTLGFLPRPELDRVLASTNFLVDG